MKLPDLESLSFPEGARILVRLDLNVPIHDGEVADDSRLQAALPTIRALLERGARPALCSHLGKAAGKPDPKYSLAPVTALLEAELGVKTVFVEDCLDKNRGRLLDEHRLLLLENLRFYPGEKKNDAEFAAALADGFSHYVNDAFGTAHRAHASVVGVPARFAAGNKAAGFLMLKETHALSRLVVDPARPFAAIVGGAKISTKTAPLEALMNRVQRLLIGGGMANTFLLAQGLETGRSLVEEDMVDMAREVMSRAEKLGVELILPVDYVVTDSIDNPTRIENLPADSIPPDGIIADLGKESAAACAAALNDAATVFWNGPMGVFEKDDFAAGTLAVARAMADCPGFTVVGGGESVMATKLAGLEAKISHVSTGGGASLEFITGKKLPAIKALEE